jgi:hypothetical protein
MDIWSIDRDAVISFTHWKVGSTSVTVDMTVRDRAFAGAYDGLVFDRTELAMFVRALAQFNVGHDGEARLEAIDPEVAVLSIRRLDMARHVLAEVMISCGHFLRDRYFFDRVTVTFELDPSQLLGFARQLAEIVGDEDAK